MAVIKKGPPKNAFTCYIYKDGVKNVFLEALVTW